MPTAFTFLEEASGLCFSLFHLYLQKISLVRDNMQGNMFVVWLSSEAVYIQRKRKILHLAKFTGVGNK